MEFMCLLKALALWGGDWGDYFRTTEGPFALSNMSLSIFSWNLATALKAEDEKFNKKDKPVTSTAENKSTVTPAWRPPSFIEINFLTISVHFPHT